MKQIEKILAIVLITMVLSASALAMSFGIWKKYFEPKISWSNYYTEQKKGD
jgi:hypothetical protein